MLQITAAAPTTSPTSTAIPTTVQPSSTPLMAETLPSPTETPAAGDPYEEIILIPQGEFWMGCDDQHNIGSDYCFEDEIPLHPVLLFDYSIDKFEVTNARYRRCVEAGVCVLPGGDYTGYFIHKNFQNHPVVNVSWENAQEFCHWANGRLPTEAEWEKAARGESPRAFPWGDEKADCKRANFAGGLGCKEKITAVDYYVTDSSPYDVVGLAGNAAEWVNDYYDAAYYHNNFYTDPRGASVGTLKVIRGGSFEMGISSLRSSSRYALPQNTRLASIGFRCVYPGW